MEGSDTDSYSMQLLSGNLAREQQQQQQPPPPPGFVAPDLTSAVKFKERIIKVDPDVAYESRLCKRCTPIRPPPWESGALVWVQAAFAFIVAIIVILMIVAIVLSAQYIAKHTDGCAKPKNRRHCRSSSSSSSSSSLSL